MSSERAHHCLQSREGMGTLLKDVWASHAGEEDKDSCGREEEKEDSRGGEEKRIISVILGLSRSCQ